MIENQPQITNKPWYKTPWGFLILLILWPVSLTYWVCKQNSDLWLKLAVIGSIWIVVLMIGYTKGPTRKSSLPSDEVSTVIPAPALLPASPQPATVVPTETASIAEETPPERVVSPEEIFQGLGKKVAKESSVTALQQEDNSWVVTNVINDWPELFSEFGAKSWVRNFMFEVYHSGYSIKQVGVTVNAPKSIGKYLRAFLGVNQAKAISDDYWKNYLLPTNFYSWLIDVSTSREEPDRANRTFVEDNL